MAEWDSGVPGCFGSADGIFAGHPSDEKRAFKLLTSLRERHIGWKAARRQLSLYLDSKGAGADHKREQLKRARRMLKPWLLD
ncbi:hypothetical protein [Methyloceanibacter sp. wino2]|uniref:hypothetical protein n=1 Tax=Methyloceanibacter sp. wino2 TaxID=2170729 RepID=UPI00131F47D8|nr:hypothetical protein [Methyloceanibacter sp. wino2]